MPDASLEAAEQALFAAINRERAAFKLAPLRWSEALSVLALGHSADMAAAGALSHDSITGASPSDRLGAAGVSFSIDGENVIRSSVADPALIHDALMKSGGHRENILRPEFDEVGIGLIRNADGSFYVTQDFIKSVAILDPAAVRARVQAAISEARTALGWPPLVVIAAVQETAQLFAALKSAGAELPPVPDGFGETRVHFYIGPDLDAIIGSVREDVRRPDARTGLGVLFARNAAYPGGAHFICVFYLSGAAEGPRP